MRALLVAVVLLLAAGASSPALADQAASVTEAISPNTAPPGGSVTVTFSATNTTAADEAPFSVALNLGQHWTVGDPPAGCSKPNAFDIVCDLPSVPAGASTPSFSTTLTVDADAQAGWILDSRVFASVGGVIVGGDARSIQVTAPAGGGGGGGAPPPPPPPPPTLSVALHGAGSGSVASTPAGIACGGACAATFPSGSSVTLTATPAAGSVFAGWGDGCASAGTSLQCAVTLNASTAVSASFDLAPPPPPPPLPPPIRCTVPSLHGLTLAAAASRLAKAHCLLGAVTRRVARKAFVGKVLSQQPAAGGRMADGARVAVVVGRRR